MRIRTILGPILVVSLIGAGTLRNQPIQFLRAVLLGRRPRP